MHRTSSPEDLKHWFILYHATITFGEEGLSPAFAHDILPRKLNRMQVTGAYFHS